MAEPEIPEKRFYQFKDWFTRVDEELEVLIELTMEMVKYLKVMAGEPAPPNTVANRLDTIIKKLDRNYPNRFNEAEVNTADTKWKDLKISGVGFAVMDLGGGFTIKIPDTNAKELTYVVGDKVDGEFSDMYVKGSGVAGKGVIRYWRRV